MGQKKYPFREYDEKISAAAATDELVFPPIKPGWVRSVRRYSLKNSTTTVAKVEILVRKIGYDHPVEEETAPVLGQLYFGVDEIFLTEGETLVFKWTGCAAADVLNAYISGYDKHVGEMEVN